MRLVAFCVSFLPVLCSSLSGLSSPLEYKTSVMPVLAYENFSAPTGASCYLPFTNRVLKEKTPPSSLPLCSNDLALLFRRSCLSIFFFLAMVQSEDIV